MLLHRNHQFNLVLAAVLALLLALLLLILWATPVYAVEPLIHHWHGEYYNNVNLTGTPVLVRDDEQINFVWGWNAPAAEVNAEQFSAYWSRSITVEPGTYRFAVTTDDEVWLWVNNSLLTDSWYDHGPTTNTGEIYLTGGNIPIRMEYYENSEYATSPVPDVAIVVDTIEDEFNNDGDCSLREAIESANTDQPIDACPAGDGHDTVLLAAGTYSLTLSGVNEDANLTGDLDILDDLTVRGSDRDETIIHGNQEDRILHIQSGVIVELEKVTLTGGYAYCALYEPKENALAGGAILNLGTLNISDTIISDSAAGDGSTMSGGSGDGGGIANWGTLHMVDTIVQGNHAGTGEFSLSGDGGGIANFGTFTAQNSRFSDNRSGFPTYYKCAAFGGNGGAIMNSGQMSLIDSTVQNNLTSSGSKGGDGGGIYNSGIFTLTRSTVNDNRTGDGTRYDADFIYPCVSYGGDGGGIFNSGQLVLFNSTVSGNETGRGMETPTTGGGGNGGGIFNCKDGSTVTATNSTIAFNTTGAGWDEVTHGGSGGGIYNTGLLFEIRNVLLTANTAINDEADDCNGSITSRGYNLIGNAEGCTLIGNNADNIIDSSPHLRLLADNGGPTWTHALTFVSPAVDGGSCTDMNQMPIAIDQRGEVRPQINSCDIGAYESAPFGEVLHVYLPFFGSTQGAK